jgi:hypothetical protein
MYCRLPSTLQVLGCRGQEQADQCRLSAQVVLTSGSAPSRGVLPVKGDIIEALWTEDNKDDEWFAVEVLLGDVGQLQARAEKRERYAKCHLIQCPCGSCEWALLSWPDRPTRVVKAGGSQSTKHKAKQEAALEVVQWRSPALCVSKSFP